MANPLDALTGVVGGAIGGIGANNAAKAQQAAANNAKRMARSNFLLGVGLNEVPRSIGYGAYADIANQFGYALPAYQSANELAATMNPLTTKQVKQYLKMGMSADQIGGIGTLAAMSPKGMKRLIKAGLSPAEIQQLATRQPSASSAAPAASAAPAGQSFIDSPDYQFRRDEGQRDIGNSFAARGGAASGNALRALTEFNQNLAASEFGNWFNRRMQLSGRGDMANNNIQTGGTQYNADYGQAQQQLGDARASGILGVAGAIQGGVSGVMNSLGSLGKYMPGQRGYSGINPANYQVPNAPISRPIDLQPMFPFGG